MTCLFCKGKSVKYGLYKNNIQRYKCLGCNKTFSETTITNVHLETNIRLVLHLILAGCSTLDIADELGLEEKIVIKWKKLYIKSVKNFLPAQPLLTIRTLISIYRGIENSSISKLNINRYPKWKK